LKIFGTNLPVCGGGYFRLLPYTIIKYALKRINTEGSPAIVYMHPYEFDADDLTQLLKKKNAKDKAFKFMQNLNRDKSESKLYNLIRDFDFCPAMEVLNLDR
jgi:hypothetical protein